MKYKWLKKTNSKELIIFFNGWGMDDYIVSSLDCGSYDVVVLYDYNDLCLDLDFEGYSKKHVVAWSMGVMISTMFYFDGVNSRAAISGTPFPISDEFGIPERIYNLTIRGFSENSVQKFMKRMFDKPNNLVKFSDRILENQKTELVAITRYSADENCKFSKVFIPKNDLIIPTKNQLNYWSKQDVFKVEIPSGHCPFLEFKSWSEILVGL